ncbi:uncharacterized protein LOC134769532 [Penaeus indicus]|uniref:uncharacterized protein LOC134769532 n=1 Tax=Penaeus indicus TaxID=29960 RepID=UPI00300C55DD
MLIISGLTIYTLYMMVMQHINSGTLLNQSHSANDTLVPGIPDSWLEVWDPPVVAGDGDDVDRLAYRVRVEADWPVVLGTYKHFKDENFEEYLTVSGVPAFMISIILSTVPLVTIQKIPDDSDYYYDMDYNNIKELDNVYGNPPEDVDTAFQMMIKTETWIRDIDMRFKLGQAFHHVEADGSDSQNTFWFVEPRVLLLDKYRGEDHHRIIYQFGVDGYNVTMVDLSRNFTAKRFFNRTQPGSSEENMDEATENGMSDMEEESGVSLNEGVMVTDGESFNFGTQALSSDRKEIVLEVGNATDEGGSWQDGWENGKENGTLTENGEENVENEGAPGSGETHKESEIVLQENRDSINSTAGEQEGNKNNNGMTNSDGVDKFPPVPESNFELFENATILEEERANNTDLFTGQNSNNRTIDIIDNDEK